MMNLEITSIIVLTLKTKWIRKIVITIPTSCRQNIKLRLNPRHQDNLTNYNYNYNSPFPPAYANITAQTYAPRMSHLIKPSRAAEILLSPLSLDLISCTELQTLWAGYGHICAVKAKAQTREAAANIRRLCRDPENTNMTFSLVLKLISPPTTRGDEGHVRKILSYKVEQYFYEQVAPSLKGDVAVATCLISSTQLADQPDARELDGITATLMTDLRVKFPVAGEKRTVLNPHQVKSSIEWLARFHGGSQTSLPVTLDEYVLPPLEEAKRRKQTPEKAGHKLWLNGGYTYLATRRSEYASLEDDDDSEWSSAFCTPVEGSTLSVAEMVAKFLTPSGRHFESYIHGDVKSENLFTTESGDRVAFFDFQYVGLGLGVCDLAKLFTCSVPLRMLTDDHAIPHELEMEEGEKGLLELYLQVLQHESSEQGYIWSLFKRHWEAALVDWCRFQASWGFWGNTEWLEARVRSILKDNGWRDWLRGELEE